MMRQVCLAEEYDVIFHLGDDYSDLNDNHDITDDKEVYRVPGIMNSISCSEKVSMIQHVCIEGWQFQLVHRQEDAEFINPHDDIVLYGHTHHPSHYRQKGILFANPGHLKNAHHRNHHASYLLITINDMILKMEWKDQEAQIFEDYTIKYNDIH